MIKLAERLAFVTESSLLIGRIEIASQQLQSNALDHAGLFAVGEENQ